TIQLHFVSYRNHAGLSVEADLDLMTGDQQKTVEVPVPGYALGYGLWWDVWVDGRHDKQLAHPVDQLQAIPATTYANQGQEFSLRVLTPLSKNVTAILTTQPAPPVTPGVASPPLELAAGTSIEITQDNIPESWMEFSSYDIVMVDVA